MSISWGDLTIPMKEAGLLSDKDSADLNYIYATQSPILREAEIWQNRILDADYESVDLKAKVHAMDYLNDK